MFNKSTRHFYYKLFLLFCLFFYLKAMALDVYKLKIYKKIPHQGFTQGLLYNKGYLYESTGLYGKSEIKKINAETGEIIKKLKISDIFAEGLALVDNKELSTYKESSRQKLYQLSWKSGLLKIYNLDFDLIGEKNYSGEGWGLTFGEGYFFMSDGSSYLQIRNKKNFELVKKIKVNLLEGEKTKPIKKINELEYVEGKLYANVWFEDYLIIFDLKKESLTGMVDCRELVAKEKKLMQKKGEWRKDNVLNGIAFDPLSKDFFLTGKNWKWIYRVGFVESISKN